jgi:hypothetical protein
MNLTQFRSASERGPRVQGSAALKEKDDDQALQAFGSESEPAPAPASEPVQPRGGLTVRIAPAMILPLVIAAFIGATAGAAALRAYQYLVLGRGAASLRIETTTPGVDVSVAGKNVGRTPVSVSLAPGSYPVVLAGVGGRRDFTVDLAGSTSVVRHIDMPSAPAPAADTAVGSLVVQTEPARLAVAVDGVDRGTSPLTLTGLKPGEHQVAVRADGAIVRRTVTIQPNENTVLVVSPVERAAPVVPNAAGGWLTVASPMSLTIREAGKLLGTTDADRLMLPAGEHNLEISNEPLGFSAKRTVRIEPGKTAALKVDPPNGVLSINAQPWAEVWIGGQRIGETPIGNLARPIGPHEVVLRHPQLGERRETVTVTLRQPARLGVDMRRK